MIEKEFRALLPLWLAVAAAMLVPQLLGRGYQYLAAPAFIIGAAALGSLSFGHEYVYRTVGLVLTLQNSSASRANSRSDEMLALVGLDPAKFGDRFPHELSGGQRQRVGVARALASDPELLLLDEPFGALDALTRTNIQKEFARLVRELGKTAVFVTHDLHEAMLLETRIALMDKGRIVLLDDAEGFRRSEIPLVRAYLDTVLMPA